MVNRWKSAMIGLAACMLGTATLADAAPAAPRPEIVERDSRGRAASVRIDGQVYKVCSAQVTDSCINPRQAGLNFGNQPLNRWPEKSSKAKSQ